MSMTKNVNGVDVELTFDEEAAVLAERAAENAPTEVASRRWEEVKAIRDRRKSGGYKVVVAGVDKWFHSDSDSRIQQLGLVQLGASIPPGLMWKTLDGSFVEMTQALAEQVFAAAAGADIANFAHAEALRASLNAVADPAALDIHAGWPPIFGES